MTYGYSMNSFDSSFSLFTGIFTIVFLLILGILLATIIKGIMQWGKNNASPRLTVSATIVSKRTDVTRRHSSTMDNHHTHFSTRYYVTFQVESGDRMELELEGNQYGLLVKGDRGNLSFQGTRYLGFERT